MPNIFTNRKRGGHAFKIEHAGLIARGKVALFVKDLVIRQTLLGIFRDQLARLNHPRHIEQLAINALGIAHNYRERQLGRLNLTQSTLNT